MGGPRLRGQGTVAGDGLSGMGRLAAGGLCDALDDFLLFEKIEVRGETFGKGFVSH